MFLRDSETRSIGSRFWWNPENTYLQISDFGNRTRAARLVVKKLTTRPTRHQALEEDSFRHNPLEVDFFSAFPLPKLVPICFVWSLKEQCRKPMARRHHCHAPRQRLRLTDYANVLEWSVHSVPDKMILEMQIGMEIGMNIYSKFRFLFKWAFWNKTCNVYSRFRFPLWWVFRVSSFWTGCITYPPT